MTTRLQLAQRLFRYDPQVTPDRQIEEAEGDLDRAVHERDSIRSQLDSLEDEALYRWDEERGSVRELQVAKTTAKFIFVAPRFDCDRQKRLPRQPLEAGAFVSHGSNWWGPEYALGATVRPKLKELLDEAEARVEDRREDQQHLQLQRAIGDLVLPVDQLETLDTFGVVLADAFEREDQELNQQYESVCWQKEGF